MCNTVNYQILFNRNDEFTIFNNRIVTGQGIQGKIELVREISKNVRNFC